MNLLRTLAVLLSVSILIGCHKDESSKSPPPQPAADAPCSNAFLGGYAKAKMAQQDWLTYRSQAHENYAVSACEKYLKNSVYTCKVDCTLTGYYTESICPRDDGKMFNGTDMKESCDYLLSL